MTETSTAYSEAERYISRSHSRDDRRRRHAFDRRTADLNASATVTDRISCKILGFFLVMFVVLPPFAIIILNSVGIIAVGDFFAQQSSKVKLLPLSYDVLISLGRLHQRASENGPESRHFNGTSSITFSISAITKKIKILTDRNLEITTAIITYGLFIKKMIVATEAVRDSRSTMLHFPESLYPDIVYKVTVTFKALAYEEAGHGLLMYHYHNKKFKPGYLSIKGLTRISAVMPVFDLDDTRASFFVRFTNQVQLQVDINPGGKAGVFPLEQYCHAKDVVLFHDPNVPSLYPQYPLATSLYAVFGLPNNFSMSELDAVRDKLRSIVPSSFHPGLPYVILRSDLIRNSSELFSNGFYATDNMIVTTTQSKVTLPFATTRVLFGSMLSPRNIEDVAFVEALADYYYFAAVAPLSEHTVTSYLGYYKDQILEGGVKYASKLEEYNALHHGAVDWISWKSAFVINGLAEIVTPGHLDNAIRRITINQIPNDLGMLDLAIQLQPTANGIGAVKINCSDGSGALNVYDYLHAYLANPTFPIIKVNRVGKDLHIMQEPAVKTEVSYPPWTIPLRHHGKLLLLCSKKMVLRNVNPPDNVEIPLFAFASNHTYQH